jgi:hypothetical protein
MAYNSILLEQPQLNVGGGANTATSTNLTDSGGLEVRKFFT